ncbi:MAG: carbohydrate kinase [Planctomycetia bacterium]|nr:carbohydrate kinase [Planctomycetia bacterium]
MFRVAGLGEVLWDCFEGGRRPGGAPANAAFQTNQLGAKGIVFSRVGADSLGEELVSFLASQNLEVSCVQKDPHHPTGTVSARLSPDGTAEYTIHESVAWDFLLLDNAWRSTLATLDAICFGTLAQRSAVSCRAIRETLKMVPDRTLKVFDVNLRQDYYSRAILEESLRLAHVVKLNEDEVEVVSRLLDLPGTSLEAFGEGCAEKFDLRKVCITRGAEGCLLLEKNATRTLSVAVPGEPACVVDTIGCGDAFSAAFIYAELSATDLDTQARFSNAVGTLVATQSGGMPILVEELSGLKRRLGFAS